MVDRQVWRIMADMSDVLVEMIQDKDAMKSERVMGAMLQMKKIDIQRLRMAYEGR